MAHPTGFLSVPTAGRIPGIRVAAGFPGRAPFRGSGLESRPVKAFRRALVALAVAGIAAGIARLRGAGGVPPQTGGWRELSGPDLR